MLEKLLLYDNQQPRPLILLVIIVWVRFIDYPKGVDCKTIEMGKYYS